MSGVKYLKGRCQHCDGHLEFPADTIGLSADCPHCGQATELMLAPPEVESGVPWRRRLLMLIIVVLIGLGGLLACMVLLNHMKKEAAKGKQSSAVIDSPPQTTVLDESQEVARRAGFQLSGVSFEKTPGSSLVYAVGTLKNPANRQRFGVRLELDLLDAAGQKVGTATDYQPALEPGGEWRFKALLREKKAVAARVAGIEEGK